MRGLMNENMNQWMPSDMVKYLGFVFVYYRPPRIA